MLSSYTRPNSNPFSHTLTQILFMTDPNLTPNPTPLIQTLCKCYIQDFLLPFNLKYLTTSKNINVCFHRYFHDRVFDVFIQWISSGSCSMTLGGAFKSRFRCSGSQIEISIMKSVWEHQCEWLLIYDHDDLTNLDIEIKFLKVFVFGCFFSSKFLNKLCIKMHEKAWNKK